ncbi:MAG: rhodanese-like domain-containing protein [Haloferacaceae archaeon]
MSPTDRSSRRAFLAGAATTGSFLLGGCLGGGSGGDSTEANDGYPPAFEQTPEERSIDTSSFGATIVEGTAVPLAPIEVAHYWYKRREARFADARGQTSYDRSHILGAVLSPAPDGANPDPVTDWPKDDLIVCYCGCPHHLSSLRAATLIDQGYENVYVIDEGFWEWHDRGYPMEGSEVTTQPAVHRIEGRTDPGDAGQTAWAWHEASGQREAATIAADGSYLLELKFSGVSLDSPIRIETPSYELQAPLEQLVSAVVTASMAQA